MAVAASLDTAAGIWLRRLQDDSKLPPRSTLEILRRREVSARYQAEELASAERRCASLVQERLEDERRLGAYRQVALEEARTTLEAEQKKRIEAEAVAAGAVERERRAEKTLAMEEDRCKQVTRERDAARQDVLDLQAMIADDASLRTLDEFAEKIKVQRDEILSLRKRLDMQTQVATQASLNLQQLRSEFTCAQLNWAKERQHLLDEIALCATQHQEAATALAALREAGAVLQSSAEETLAACTNAAAQCATQHQEAISELASLCEAGAVLQNSAEATLAVCTNAAEATVAAHIDPGELQKPVTQGFCPDMDVRPDVCLARPRTFSPFGDARIQAVDADLLRLAASLPIGPSL